MTTRPQFSREIVDVSSASANFRAMPTETAPSPAATETPSNDRPVFLIVGFDDDTPTLVTAADLGTRHADSAYGHDMPPAVIKYVHVIPALDVLLVPVDVITARTPFEDDYADVTGYIRRRDNAAIVGTFSYRLDGRA